jgi:predicted RNA-binding protein
VCLATVYLETEGKKQEVMRDVAWVKPQESGLEFITLLGTSKLFHGRIKSIDLLHGSIVLEGMENEHADL